MQGVFTSFGTNIDLFFKPLGFSSSLISAMGFCMTLCGVISSLVVGFFLAKYQRYLLTARTLIASSLIIIILATLSFRTDLKGLIFINMVLLSMCTIPIIPLSIGFSAELGFPHEEAVTNGFLLMCGQGTSFVISLLTLLPFVEIDPAVGVLFLSLLILISLGISIMINENLKRSKHDQRTLNRKSLLSAYSGAVFSTKFF